MNFSDILSVMQWWLMFFLIGIVFLPLTSLIFNKFFDKGYIFSKIIGIAFISYIVFVLGFLRILPFDTQNVFFIALVFLLINLFIKKKIPLSNIKLKSMLPIFILEEFIFILILLLWSLIHAHQPEIHGLEKYMDFGFINSILRANYFPPKDMWFTPFYINYYYFGHLVTAVLTKMSFMLSYITYNLMLSTISSLTFVGAFSIGANLIYQFKSHPFDNLRTKVKIASQKLIVLAGGILTAFILNFAGNLHTIYTFFKPYENEHPVPFWQLAFSPSTFPNGYWYPNATRFIENTIHEFPIYSSVVADLHGHFLDVPFVLLTIAILLSLVLKSQIINHKSQINSNFQNTKLHAISNFGNWNLFGARYFEFRILLLAFLLAIMYMTSAWDGIIYFLLAVIIIFIIQLKSAFSSHSYKSIKYSVLSIMQKKSYILHTVYYILLLGLGFIAFTLPFNLNFKPFASGIGVLCAPEFLTNMEKFGPLIFEKGHCQRSPLWQLIILHGFFYFWVISFIIFLLKNYKLSHLNFIKNLKLLATRSLGKVGKIENLPVSDIFILILILLSTFLIIIPEFIYVKDIYPAHYRANSMFKLVYQAFIMLSIASAYIIIRIMPIILRRVRYTMTNIFNFYFVFFIFSILFFILVMIYPYFAINAYYGNLRNYQGLDGTKYLNNLYATDYQAIQWINKNIENQPVILEAQGDSYTNYARVSSNTGLPTVLGWTVHEWLWRGSYDIPSPRIEDVKTLYETNDLAITKQLIKKYNVSLVFIGDLEKQKYLTLSEEKFSSLGKIIYQNGKTKIYQIN